MPNNISADKSHPVVILRDEGRKYWLHFSIPSKVFITREIDEVMPLLGEIGEKVERYGKYAAGFISYEAASAFDAALKTKQDREMPLLWFGIFDKVQEITLPVASQKNLVSELDWRQSISPEDYRRCFERIKEYISAGDTYQVNYTYRLHTPFCGDSYQLFQQLVSGNEPPYAAYIDIGDWAICSTSPELFFRLEGENMESHPMKGTAGRGLWFEQDVQQGEWLRTSEKDRAENLMIVDMVRNDLGRIADTGTVNVPSLFDINRYPTVWQMTSTVRAKMQAPLDEIFKALFPPASITGAPKPRTMEIINELESSPRRIYTGAIGYAAPGRKMQFNVAIRTILIDKKCGSAEYGVGGGIVWDSQLESEKSECRIKSRALHAPAPDFDLLETMLWTAKDGYYLLAYHIKRLIQSAEYFDFKMDSRYIELELIKWAEKLPKTSHKIRLLVSKKGTVAIESSPFETVHAGFPDIVLAASPIDSLNPFLYHKTTNRRVYQNAINAMPGFQDVLLYNDKGEVTESTIANIAVELHGILYTPPVQCGLLQGTYREWMLEQKRIVEKEIRIDDIPAASNIYLMNALRGMHKVRVIHSPAEATTF